LGVRISLPLVGTFSDLFYEFNILQKQADFDDYIM